MIHFSTALRANHLRSIRRFHGLDFRAVLESILASERSGFYLSVAKEGEVAAGDEFELIEKSEFGVRVVDVTRLYSSDKGNVDLLRRAIATEALPQSWRSYFQERLAKLTDKH